MSKKVKAWDYENRKSSNMDQNFLSLDDASRWATEYIGRPVTTYNIGYLLQYAKIRRHYDAQKKLRINQIELRNYYDGHVIKKQESWKIKLGQDLNWALSFEHLRESDTTKHVHRLHPYKGKFIPQLVEYFLDGHVNKFKKRVFFQEGNVILDPFMGSGTTLIQSSELSLHSIGIDISEFNCLMAKVKSDDYDFFQLNSVLKNALSKTIEFSNRTFEDKFDLELKERLAEFNKKYFPCPEFRNDVIRGEVAEIRYGEEKLKQFLKENEEFFEKNGTRDRSKLFDEKEIGGFLSKWFSKRIKQELFYYLKLIDEANDDKIKNVLRVALSRTARSCRATTHSDLATLKEPQIGPYYCRKHGKICTPVNSILKHLIKNTYDTVERLREYSNLKKKVHTSIIHGDSREVNIFEKIKNKNPDFYKLLMRKKIDGVFTSPPYVGQIDYHEQHAYAYELFDIPRMDAEEIGPLFKGQGEQAKNEYVEGISKVLSNVSKFVKDDGDFFIVANDKYDLYPAVAEKSNLKIVDRFKRPVLNRTERDRQPYAEIIFHMKKNI